ncbi:MAG: hypothetical protein ABH806_00290 [Candidatus Omnitrophota bacterium]
MSKDIEVSLVLPCLNEEESIGDSINKIRGEGISAEIIVAYGGSLERYRQIA